MFYLLSIQGQNRTGMVAEVTALLFDKQVNILDSSMTTLRSEFAMMLVIALPESLDSESFQSEVRGLETQGFCVVLRPLSEAEACHSSAEAVSDYSLSVVGRDRTGLVYHFSKLLADHGANITDLNTRLMDASEPPLYAMIMEVHLPEASRANGAVDDFAVDDLKQSVLQLGAELGVDAHVHYIESVEIWDGHPVRFKIAPSVLAANFSTR